MDISEHEVSLPRAETRRRAWAAGLNWRRLLRVYLGRPGQPLCVLSPGNTWNHGCRRMRTQIKEGYFQENSSISQLSKRLRNGYPDAI